MGEEGAQVVGVGWVLLQGRGEMVTLLVLEAQLSYGLIMLGNEKKKATGLLAAGSLRQAVPGWIREAHGSDGSCRSPRQFFGIVAVVSHAGEVCQNLPQPLDGPTVSVTFILLCGNLNESSQFSCVGTTEQMHCYLLSASVSS